MKATKILSLLLVLVLLVASFAACGDKKDDGGAQNTTVTTKPVEFQEIDLADVVEHADHTSVYEMIGSKVTADMVEETEDGLAYVTVDGVKYELGMDFLSMAMVYNTAVPANSKFANSDAIYNFWWKLYIQRWNYLAPEVPLYANQYFDLYNAKLENFVTSPYWGPADAIVAAKVKTGETNSVILGSSTDLSGNFRNSAWGVPSPGGSDLDIQNLTSGHSTIQTNASGAYIWNTTALAETPTSVLNSDGTLTYTIKIKSGLVFSDGSAITAKNYIAGVLANSSPVGVAAGGSGSSGLNFVGYDEFKAYTGANDGADVEGEDYKASKYFSGVKLLDDYTFSVTIVADYSNYYYSMGYAAFSPDPLALYLGSKGDIIVDPETKACGLNADFYATEKVEGVDTYKVAAEIVENLKWNSALPYSGPYVVNNYDASTKTATLKLNPNYTGDVARGVASIETISYIKVVPKTQMDMFKKGEVDVIAGITGGAETKAALKIVNDNPSKYAETHYDRAGYGKLGFRADFGPTGFVEVRQAIMYTINRPDFAQTFTGGFGAVVHGPYYTGYSAYKAVENDIILNKYIYSADSAIAVLEEGGWVYNIDGSAYDASKGGIRYKKLSGYELTADNLTFKTTDGKYKTVKVDGSYYMPLAINWYGTADNPVTDQLLTAWQTNPVATSQIGMYITYTLTDFNTGIMGELQRQEKFGYNGVPKLNAINFATNFTSAVYDYSWNWTINPELFDLGYSVCFVKDEADFWENYQ